MANCQVSHNQRVDSFLQDSRWVTIFEKPLKIVRVWQAVNPTQGGFLPGIGSVAGASAEAEPSPRWQRVRRWEPDGIGTRTVMGECFLRKQWSKMLVFMVFCDQSRLKTVPVSFFLGGAQRCSFCFARTIQFFLIFFGST